MPMKYNDFSMRRVKMKRHRLFMVLSWVLAAVLFSGPGQLAAQETQAQSKRQTALKHLEKAMKQRENKDQSFKRHADLLQAQKAPSLSGATSSPSTSSALKAGPRLGA